jgi:hypothetical protein
MMGNSGYKEFLELDLVHLFTHSGPFATHRQHIIWPSLVFRRWVVLDGPLVYDDMSLEAFVSKDAPPGVTIRHELRLYCRVSIPAPPAQPPPAS